MIKKKDLEICLQKLAPMDQLEASLEQYATPARIATDILFTAFVNGDISGKKVLDLGCGNGIFALGSWLLGAEEVRAVDVSSKALSVAEKNAASLGADIHFENIDVRDYQGKSDTVVMNPPFGSQKKGADRPFLDAAMGSADAIYSLHMSETLPFLDKYITSQGRHLSFHKEYKYDIPHLFTFHRKMKESINIVMIIIR